MVSTRSQRASFSSNTVSDGDMMLKKGYITVTWSEPDPYMYGTVSYQSGFNHCDLTNSKHPITVIGRKDTRTKTNVLDLISLFPDFRLCPRTNENNGTEVLIAIINSFHGLYSTVFIPAPVEGARAFYLKFGFLPVDESTMRLYMNLPFDFAAFAAERKKTTGRFTLKKALEVHKKISTNVSEM